MAMQVPALAAVIGYAVTGVEFQSACDQHDNARKMSADYSILALRGVQWFNPAMPDSAAKLSIFDHSRASAGLKYVYPVVSRRAGGVSVGINLNTNNACNWRCIYCQVPDLRYGSAPPVDLPLLGSELREFLAALLHGDFMTANVPPEARRLNDIALSGNGEPTSAAEFEQVIELIGQVLDELGLAGLIKLVLITNGSLLRRPGVLRGLTRMARLNGEVWFKLDSATPAGRMRINHTRQTPGAALENLRAAARLCPTWIQTALFEVDGLPPSATERQALLNFLARCKDETIPLHGVLLYGLARPSFQPEAAHLSALSASWLENFAAEIEVLGLPVRLSS